MLDTIVRLVNRLHARHVRERDTREALRSFIDALEGIANGDGPDDIVDAVFFADLAAQGLPEGWRL